VTFLLCIEKKRKEKKERKSKMILFHHEKGMGLAKQQLILSFLSKRIYRHVRLFIK
jgi:hypothetical protein